MQSVSSVAADGRSKGEITGSMYKRSKNIFKIDAEDLGQ